MFLQIQLRINRKLQHIWNCMSPHAKQFQIRDTYIKVRLVKAFMCFVILLHVYVFTLISYISILFGKNIYKRLIVFLENCKIIYEKQFGFEQMICTYPIDQQNS